MLSDEGRSELRLQADAKRMLNDKTGAHLTVSKSQRNAQWWRQDQAHTASKSQTDAWW